METVYKYGSLPMSVTFCVRGKLQHTVQVCHSLGDTVSSYTLIIRKRVELTGVQYKNFIVEKLLRQLLIFAHFRFFTYINIYI